MRTRTYSHDFAEEILSYPPRNQVKDEILQTLANMVIVHEGDQTPHEQVQRVFQQLSWRKNHRIFGREVGESVDCYKKKVAIEVDFETGPGVYSSILKLQSASLSHKIDVGVSILFTKRYIKANNLNEVNTPSFDKIKRDLSGIHNRALNLPLLLIGLDG